MPSYQGTQYTLHQLRAAQVIGNGQPKWHGIVFGVTGCISEAAHRLQQQILARPVFPGTFFAVAADGAIYNTCVYLFYFCVTQAYFFHDTGAEVMRKYI